MKASPSFDPTFLGKIPRLRFWAAEIAERDRLDSTRKVAPLRPAEDAVHIDTDPLTPQQVADAIVARVRGEAA